VPVILRVMGFGVICVALVCIQSTNQSTFGSIKVGNGGSGVMFNYDWLGDLTEYFKLHRGADNVDVLMWRCVTACAAVAAKSCAACAIPCDWNS
jgi:hypothetical protein